MGQLSTASARRSTSSSAHIYPEQLEHGTHLLELRLQSRQRGCDCDCELDYTCQSPLGNLLVWR